MEVFDEFVDALENDGAAESADWTCGWGCGDFAVAVDMRRPGIKLPIAL